MQRLPLPAPKTLFLALLLVLASVVPVAGQRVYLDGVRISSGVQSGQTTLPPYAAFIASTRNPALFRGGPRKDAVADGETALSGLAIDFLFGLRGRPRHAFAAGFARQTLTATLYALPAADRRTPGIALTAANEYISLRGGYQYRLWPTRRVAAFAGVRVEVAAPVSALSTEAVGDSLVHENRFFARRAALLAVGMPVGLRVRLTRVASLTLALHAARLWTRLDGNRIATTVVGLDLGVQFLFGRRDR